MMVYRWLLLAILVPTALPPPLQSQAAIPTTITLGSTLYTGVNRFGINLGGQSFYDSGQMLRNLVSRNPGFEGETWQAIVQCKSVTRSTCTTADQYSVWPADFLANATFEILSGASHGKTGSIVSNTAIGAAGPNTGPSLSFSSVSAQPASGDFIVLRKSFPGRADAGWWVNAQAGSVSTEYKDLPPNTKGKQALRVEAAGSGQHVTLSSFFDSTATRSFVQMHGTYRLSFQAKQIAGTQPLTLVFRRLNGNRGNQVFLSKVVPTSTTWKTFSFDFETGESYTSPGTLDLTFTVAGTSILLDDVFLGKADQAGDNPTAFRDEVVQALRDVKPGVLRFMDGANFGSSLDNMLAPAFGRQRAGFSTQQVLQEDIPIGLPEFLELCAAVGTEPWYSLPPGVSESEVKALIEYLAGASSTPYGAKRSASGREKPWTSVFPVIHLELGNEQWNYGTFAGATINDPTSYGARANQIFTAARSAPEYKSTSFDLVLGSWNAVPWWTEQELKASTAHDSVAVAPYLFDNFNDASSLEAVFGPMFAQPEAIDSRPTGLVVRQAASVKAAARPARLVVYETNLGTMSGSVTQSALDAAVPSLGAGLAAVDHMLLTLRDGGVKTQCFFALPEYSNPFKQASGPNLAASLWGSVVDMGGQSDGRRPSFLALKLANEAILPTMIRTIATGANPVWNQPQSRNDGIQLAGAHLIQSFAFANGSERSLILINLSRTDTLPVIVAGRGVPAGKVNRKVLTGKRITDNNETRQTVATTRDDSQSFSAGASMALPPFSMTTLSWRTVP